ncbi:hypothetical protein BDP81DRAFT_108584 [Colletotrichum phormii]|uniref:Uncharacterized protein n=1 Tax=Colletotrichum phormii TaxID=359342 RepID=A0AAI9ZGX0_9PEZI|nr:uncharacterized protein BDP81DRAFT_108584 [Colletotrichum phormii]KAK1624364.1 hypothetical protein BDP81DRAFT_108584 [Colletotrichum phormii]
MPAKAAASSGPARQPVPSSLRGHPPITPSPPVFTMELQSRECPAPSRSGDAPNFCLIKLDLPGPGPRVFPRSLPVLKRTCAVDATAPPRPFLRFCPLHQHCLQQRHVAACHHVLRQVVTASKNGSKNMHDTKPTLGTVRLVARHEGSRS